MSTAYLLMQLGLALGTLAIIGRALVERAQEVGLLAAAEAD